MSRIYCANHASHLDTVLVLAALAGAGLDLPRPVAAAGYWRANRWRRWMAERLFRTVFLEREACVLNPLAAAFAALRAGDSLLYFPEGTRGPGGAVRPLKPGIYYLARAFREVEIVPVWIEGASRALPKGAWIPRPAACAVHFGAPLRWDGVEPAEAFLERLRKALEAARDAGGRAPALAAPVPALR